LAAVVVPLAIGGLVGGRLGGLVTAVVLVPWLDRLLRGAAPSGRS
jgi:hypothetical protein